MKTSSYSLECQMWQIAFFKKVDLIFANTQNLSTDKSVDKLSLFSNKNKFDH